MQFYNDPLRQHDTHSLPDAEVFHASYAQCPKCNEKIDVSAGRNDDMYVCDGCDRSWHTADLDIQTGFYYWFVYPGCLPDFDPIGPYATEAEAQSHCEETCAGDE